MTRVAAIDAGSNAIRFVVADFDGPRSYTVVHKIREPIRLGHNVFTRGGLDEEAMDLALAAFRLFRRQIDALGVERFRAVATSATREAANRDLFLDRILALNPASPWSRSAGRRRRASSTWRSRGA